MNFDFPTLFIHLAALHVSIFHLDPLPPWLIAVTMHWDKSRPKAVDLLKAVTAETRPVEGLDDLRRSSPTLVQGQTATPHHTHSGGRHPRIRGVRTTQLCDPMSAPYSFLRLDDIWPCTCFFFTLALSF